MNDPRGQFGSFMRDWIDNRNGGETEKLIAGHMGLTTRAVRKWCEGVSAPSLAEFDRLAKFLGYADWSKLAAAVVKHAKS